MDYDTFKHPKHPMNNSWRWTIYTISNAIASITDAEKEAAANPSRKSNSYEQNVVEKICSAQKPRQNRFAILIFQGKSQASPHLLSKVRIPDSLQNDYE